MGWADTEAFKCRNSFAGSGDQILGRIPFAVIFAICLINSGTANARPALLFNAQSGAVLYAEDIDRPWHPASLTKLMTAYLTFEAMRAGKITDQSKVVCSRNALSQPPLL